MGQVDSTETPENSWNVDLFAVEAGARGYCPRLVLCCFKSLGLRNRTINTTVKQLNKCSMECSFCIWLAGNNKAWSSEEIDLSLKLQKIHLFTKIHCQPSPKQII